MSPFQLYLSGKENPVTITTVPSLNDKGCGANTAFFELNTHLNSNILYFCNKYQTILLLIISKYIH